MAKVKKVGTDSSPRILNSDIKNLGILGFDNDNSYPQRIIDISNDSGTAKTCIRLFSRFVMGRGAKDVEFYKSKINENGLTIDNFIRKTTNQIAKFGGCAIHVNFTGNLKTVDVSIIPFEYCRIGTGEDKGKIKIYDDWNNRKRNSIDKKLITILNVWNPENVQREVEECGGIENYKGQILYYTPEGLEYPLSPFDAVLEDMETESELKRFKRNTAKNNFLASHILITGKTESDEDAEEFQDDLNAFQGSEGAGTILWLEREDSEEQIELKDVNIQKYDGLYSYTELSCKSSIREQFLQPEILLLKSSGGGIGGSEELAVASDYYNSITYDNRLVIEELLKEIFSNFYRNICPSNDYSIIPLKYSKPISSDYLQYYTSNEIRQSNGDEPLEDTKSDVKLLATTMGSGGVQSITALISDVTLSVEVKKGMLKVVFGLTESQTNEILGLTNTNER